MVSVGIELVPGTDEHFAKLMAELSTFGDPESQHGLADDLLCKILEKLGFSKTVAEFHKLEKWYS